MEDRNQIHSNQRALILTLSGAILTTVFCAIQLLRIPSDSKNAFLFGLSKERLLMLSGFALIFVFNLICFFRQEQCRSFLSKISKKNNFILLLLIITLFLQLMPDYRFGTTAAYFTRIKPYILWGFLNALILFLYTNYTNNNFENFKILCKNIWAQKKFILPTLALLCGGIAFVEITGLGKTAESSLWNKNGIPLQSIQLFAALIIFSFAWKCGFLTRIGKRRLLTFFAIWAVSALIWSLAPMEDHFFAPGPYAPNGQYYPYSDALNYDFAGQTALHGWGFNFRRTLLKPTLVFITFLNHLVTGSNYNLAMRVQSAVFAILPAIIYLFGSAIGGEGCGLLAALFSMLKEWNSLQTKTVLTVHSRLFMSEFLTQILFAVFCYVLFRWLKRDKKEILYAIIAGGILVVGFFTRYNFAALLPAALLIVIIAYRKNFRGLIKTLFFFLLAMSVTAAPLLYREKDMGWGLIPEFKYTVETILLKNRLSNPTQEPPSETSSVKPDAGTEKTKSSEPGIDNIAREHHTAESYKNAAAFGHKELSQKASVSNSAFTFPKADTEGFNTGQITQEFSNNSSTLYLPVFQSIINHGMHNFIASALTLPMELTFQDLEHLYTQEADGLWRDAWAGEFSFRQWLCIAVWVILGAVSIGILIKEHGTAGFSLPYFWLVYSFSIGISRSSGGRYVVPTNWIPMMLLAYCLTLILSKGKISLEERKPASLQVWQPVSVLFGFFAFFTAMYLFENYTPRTNNLSAKSDLEILQEQLADHTEIDWELVKNQQSQGILHITHGNAIYPRFYYFRDGENVTSDLLMWKEYSRMTFTGINLDPDRRNLISQGYLLPHTSVIENFPQESVFHAISCSNENGYQDVLAVTIETKDGEVFTYVRDPLPAFSCPVPEPVCYSLENCK